MTRPFRPRTRVTIHVCPTCGYWPINGEEHAASCKHCGNREATDGSLRQIYRAASGLLRMPTVPQVMR